MSGESGASCGQPEEQGLDVHMTEAAPDMMRALPSGMARPPSVMASLTARRRPAFNWGLGSFDKSSREFWQSSTEERSAKQIRQAALDAVIRAAVTD
jgi:hypothetical protein